jgi:hypothetical protein
MYMIHGMHIQPRLSKDAPNLGIAYKLDVQRLAAIRLNHATSSSSILILCNKRDKEGHASVQQGQLEEGTGARRAHKITDTAAISSDHGTIMFTSSWIIPLNAYKAQQGVMAASATGSHNLAQQMQLSNLHSARRHTPAYTVSALFEVTTGPM